MTREFVPALPVEFNRGLALVGYRGTGKSTVGRILADKMRRPFLDADTELETRAGRSVRAILGEDGEPAFRDWEERILTDLIARFPTAVIATGGGAIVRESTRIRLREFGRVVWLTAAPDILASRLASDPPGLAARPPLTAAGTLEEIARVLASRTAWYREVAHVVIDTAGKTPDQVARTILETWSS